MNVLFALDLPHFPPLLFLLYPNTAFHSQLPLFSLSLFKCPLNPLNTTSKCIYPLEYGQSTRGHNLEKSWLSFLSSHQMPNAPSRSGALRPPPSCMLGLCLAWVYTSILHAVTEASSSDGQLPCCEQKTVLLEFYTASNSDMSTPSSWMISEHWSSDTI